MHVIMLHDDLPPDARADELDVFEQATAVEEALHGMGHDTARLPFSLDLATIGESLGSRNPDIVFNLVESVGGHGRLAHLAPALLDALGYPYTGTRTEGLFLTTSKVLTKRMLRLQGLPTPEWLDARGASQPGDLPGGRYLIKPIWEDASVGLEDDAVVAVTQGSALPDLVRARGTTLGLETFAERYIDGREFNLSVLADSGGPEVLPVAEIHFVDYAPERPRLVGYRAKWDSQSFEYHHTPRSFDFPDSDEQLLSELRRLALACWDLFGLDGYVRVDFRVDGKGQPWVLEINANPCLSPDAGFVAATQRAGLDFPEVVARIVAAASSLPAPGAGV